MFTVNIDLFVSSRTVPNLYNRKLIEEGLLSEGDIERTIIEHNDWLNDELKRAELYSPMDPSFKQKWSGFQQATDHVSTWNTGVNLGLLKIVAEKSVSVPKDFVGYFILMLHDNYILFTSI